MTHRSAIFPGQSEMAARMRAVDWALTPLGATEQWPIHLRATLAGALTSRIPVHLWWGAARTFLYNDAHVSLLGQRHPASLARSGADAWPEIWEAIAPMIADGFSEARASAREDIRICFGRVLPDEEVFVSLSLSPIVGPDGHVDGLLGVCSDTTETVVSHRRLDTLARLSAGTVADSVADVCEAAAAVLAPNPSDVPWALFYAVEEDRRTARLITAIGVDAVGRRPPARVPLDGRKDEWADPAHPSDVLPLMWRERVIGVFVAGLSSHRPYDDGYRAFLKSIAGVVSAAMADVQAQADLRMQLRDRTDEQRRAREEAGDLIKRLVAANETERRQIGAGVHDTLGQHMTALRLGLEALQGLTEPQPALSTHVLRLNRLARELDESIDFLTWDLRPQALDNLGLCAALESLANGFAERFGIAAVFDGDGAVDFQLGPDAELNLYRIAQEGLHNVIKHARATKVRMSLWKDAHATVLTLKDNGRGYDVAEMRGPALHERIGLVSMRERARAAGGELAVGSVPGSGTTITVRIARHAAETEGS